ncbi:helix-turn-helix domain-containing protein [Hydrocarboniclastica marina]|uniref:XRE family transcriptional regulator n=1 Tax=Hydrocarboniclastica marina TaxID=2259620 RepID=A0A4P7XKM0_9ALTE|nr:helix-turn-helix transcriptional regulator [Hydrocarboniclastica marina]QCF26477.1 XRE family transcriptional regulator [Hydrocarboniclastica marina]
MRIQIQIIEKEGKPEYAVIPYDECLKLLELAEDAIDLTDADKAMRELARGDDERVPAEVTDRLLSGDEHPLKVWREHRGMTQEALGATANVVKSYISQIEAFKKAGSTRVLRALAGAIDVDVDDLLVD